MMIKDKFSLLSIPGFGNKLDKNYQLYDSLNL